MIWSAKKAQIHTHILTPISRNRMKACWITYFTEPRKGIQINFFASLNNMEIRHGELKTNIPLI